jgi:peptidoglycan-associated lipoprotein
MNSQYFSCVRVLALTGAMAVAITGCHKKVVTQPPQPTQVPVAQRTEEPKAPPAAINRTPEAKPTPVQPPKQQATTFTPEQRRLLNDILARMEDALFDYDKSTIRPDAVRALESDIGVVREMMSAYPAEKLSLQGHADSRGSNEYNLALGDRRSMAVKEFLVTMGIAERQLETISYGEEKPACTDETEACWQKNRRVHLTVATR